MNLRQPRKIAIRNAFCYGNSSLLGSGPRRKREGIFSTKNYGSILLKHTESSPTPGPNLQSGDQNCKAEVFNQLGRLHRASSLQGNPSMTIAASRLTRERYCKGTAYLSTSIFQSSHCLKLAFHIDQAPCRCPGMSSRQIRGSTAPRVSIDSYLDAINSQSPSPSMAFSRREDVNNPSSVLETLHGNLVIGVAGLLAAIYRMPVRLVIDLRQAKKKAGQHLFEVSNHRRRPTHAEKLSTLVEQMATVRKNPADLGCSGLVCLVSGRGKAFTRAKVNGYSAPFYRKLGMPSPSIGAYSDLNRFERHDEFVGIHFGNYVGANQVASNLAAGRPEDWTSVYRSFFFASLLYRGSPNRKVDSNHQEMSAWAILTGELIQEAK